VEYFQNVSTHQASAATTASQIKAVVRLIPKSAIIDELSDPDMTRYVAKRRGESPHRSRLQENPPLVAPATINREVQLLKRMCNWAAKAMKVAVPDIDWSQHSLPEPKERICELAETQETALFRYLRDDFHGFVSFALISGLRVANIIGLTWNQVNLHDRIITIRTQSNRPGGDVHTIPITEMMFAILTAQKGNNTLFVFTYVAKKRRAKMRQKGERYPFTKDGWRKAWAQALDAAGIDDFRFHDLRHTAATRLLRNSNNLALAQHLLGHQDISTTMKYAHVRVEDLRVEMEKVPNYSRTTAKDRA
jgi:integrase